MPITSSVTSTSITSSVASTSRITATNLSTLSLASSSTTHIPSTNQLIECSNYCKNGGICSLLLNNQLACNCTNTGYEGEKCESPLKKPKDEPKNSNYLLYISSSLKRLSDKEQVIFERQCQSIKFC